MNIQEEIITPKRAQELLTLNTSNRPLNRRHVLFLAAQMRDGKWMSAADPIRISQTNRLLGGQHRLTAIIESDTPIRMLIISGLDDETFQVMDTGRNRTAADVVSIQGQPNANVLAATIKMILLYQKGKTPTVGQKVGRGTAGVTNADIVAFLNAGNDLQPIVAQGRSLYNQSRILGCTEYCFLYWLLSTVNQSQSLLFLTSLATGLNLSADSPIYLLRRKLENYKINKIAMGGRERMALILKAWNLVRTGKTVSLLVYNPDKEAFPEPL